MGALLDRSQEVLQAIARVGKDHHACPTLHLVKPFAGYLKGRELDASSLDMRDGGVTRREALVRYLVLSCVVDQGPDIEGVQWLVTEVTNRLYRRKVRFFHRPLDFFEHLRMSLDGIDTVHALIKKKRAAQWAAENKSTAAKYNLFIESGQTLGYAIFRWGAPLALIHLTVEAATMSGNDTATALSDYLRGHPSTEEMSIQLKSHSKFGLGKAIGNKAAHLFAKWVVHSFPLLSDRTNPAWDAWSFEVPFDSNAGRVLYRTGLLDAWGTAAAYRESEVLQPRKGKERKTYLRVTNLRGIHSTAAASDRDIVDANIELCTKHLCTHAREPRKIEIQRLPSIVSLIDGDYTPGQIDDGLIHIGTTWCFNHNRPNCKECPLRRVCAAANGKRSLITNVRT